MTLKQILWKITKLIEEYDAENASNYCEDEDFDLKIRDCINSIMYELCRFKKIPAIKEIEVQKDEEYIITDTIKDFYQLKKITGVDYSMTLNEIIFLESGKAKIYYYKYPEMIDDNTSTNYKFELSMDALEILPLGVAGLILASDPSNGYGNTYTQLYESKKQYLDSRLGPSYFIEGGYDI